MGDGVQTDADCGVERPGDAAGQPNPRSFAHEHWTMQIIRWLRRRVDYTFGHAKSERIGSRPARPDQRRPFSAGIYGKLPGGAVVEGRPLVLTFTLDEGPPYRFGKVDIESHMKTVDPASLHQDLRTHPGDGYDADISTTTLEQR